MMETWLPCRFFFLILIFGYSTSQINRCQSGSTTSIGGTPTIYVTFNEASLEDLLANPDNYLHDTTINGIAGSTDSFTGITLTLSSAPSTPSSVNVNSYFSLEMRNLPSPDNGWTQRAFIRLKRPLDRDGTTASTFDDLNVIDISVQCQPVGSTQPTFFLMTVNVQDINDNSPVFTGTPYNTNVNELSPIGITVFKDIAAIDIDSGANKDIDFAIVAGGSNIIDGSQKFSIPTPRLGNVVIKSVLDFEQLNAIGQTYYILNISATDLATIVAQRRVTYTTLRIDITDGNDLPPVFVVPNCVLINNTCFYPTYTTVLITNSIGGVLTLRPENNQAITTSLAAQDQDMLNASIVFSVVETIPSGYENRFVTTGTGNQGKLYTASLSQTQAINRNTEVKYLEIIVKAQEETAQARYGSTVIKVTIVQANNFPPVVKASFTGYINENSPLGTAPTSSDGSALLRVNVTDQDLAPGEVGQYTLTVEGTSDFTVTSDGYIRLNTNNLNYESTPSFTVTVRATEVGTNQPRNGSTTVTVIVRDLNDNTPTFTSPSYQVSTAEQDYSTSPKLLLTVSANDFDNNANGDINFSIVSVTSNGIGNFRIVKTSGSVNPQTAAISINGSVLEGEKYVIIVKAEDSATTDKRSSTVPVQVDITGTGIRPPVIPASVYTLSISECTPVGTSIFTIPATDPERSALTYAITSGNNGDYAIDINTGVITTARALDREVTPSYSLGLRATDITSLHQATTLVIDITDGNDLPPVFVVPNCVLINNICFYPTYTTVLITNSIGGVLTLRPENNQAITASLAAQDQDTLNASIIFSVVHTIPSGYDNRFVTMGTGNQAKIYTASVSQIQAINRNTEVKYLEIIVKAQEQTAQARYGSAVIKVTIVQANNFNPVVTASFTGYINENSPLGTAPTSSDGSALLRINVTDLDLAPGEVGQYTFTVEGTSDFTVTSDGYIRLSTNNLNYDSTENFTFIVRATEVGTNQPKNGATRVTVIVSEYMKRLILEEQPPITRIISGMFMIRLIIM